MSAVFRLTSATTQVLHIDRNNYYGGQSASLNLNQVCPASLCGALFVSCSTVAKTTALNPCLQLYERFRPGQKPPTKLGSSRDYNVDMVPKFIMAGGELVRVLVHTGAPLSHTHFAAAGSALFTDTECTAFGLLNVILSVTRSRRCMELQYFQLCVIPTFCCRRHKVLGVQGCRWQLCAQQECGTEGASNRHGGHQISSHGLAGEEQSTQVFLVSTAYCTVSQSISAVSQSTSDVAVQQATAGTAILRMLDTTNNVRSHCMPKQLLHAALLL